MPNGIYYVDDYSGTDFAKITAAVNAANAAGGGKVALSNRTYYIDQSIVLHRQIVFCGVGRSSCIICSADVPIIRIDSTNDDSFNIEIRDLVLSYDSMDTSNCFHIEAKKPYRLIIYGAYFYATGRTYSGVLTWDGSDRTLPISNQNANTAAFMTHIENCLFSSGSIWLNDSDSRIINNYIWANNSVNNLNYAIRLSNGAVNISGNDIVPGKHSGVYLASTCSGIRIENNYFDGSWDNVNTGWGVYASGATQCLIIGNTFANIYKGGIYSASTFQLNIAHNQFIDLNRSGASATCYDIKINGTSSQMSVGHVIEGNIHKRTRSGTKSYAVQIGTYANAAIINNSLIDWGDGGSYRKPPFVINNHGKYSLRKDNRVTDSSGTYPFQFDEGSVIVQHNSSVQSVYVSFAADFVAQNIVPRVQDIDINFVGAASNSSVVYSIWDISASGFYISFRPVDTSSVSSGTFYWRVSLQ